MAITYTPQPDPFRITPCLLVDHWYLGPPNDPPEFHTVGLWYHPNWNIGTYVVLLAYDPDTEYDPDVIYDIQLTAADLLIHRPSVVASRCWDCRNTFRCPAHLVWNIDRNDNAQPMYPVCAYEAPWFPAHWTPDKWPPDRR